MSEQRITAKYLADLFNLNPETVRKYARELREMLVRDESVWPAFPLT